MVCHGFYRPLGGVDTDRNKTEDKGGTTDKTTGAVVDGWRRRWWRVHVVARTSPWRMVTGAAAGGHSPEIDEHDKSSGGDTGLNDSTRQPTDLRIQCIEFLLPADEVKEGEGEGTPCKYLSFPSSIDASPIPRFGKFAPFSKRYSSKGYR